MTATVLLLAAALSAGNAEFDRTALEGAARIALDRQTAELVRTGLPTGELAKVMLYDPASYRERGAAETLARRVYSNALERAFTEHEAAIRKRLGLAATFPLAVKDSDRAALLDRYAAVFAAEREAAVRAQAKDIVTVTRPTESELEGKSDHVLRQEMTERILAEQRSPVFEENRQYVSDQLVTAILASGHEECRRQEEYVKRVRSDAFVPSKMEKDLADHLRANVAEQAKHAEPSKAWGVFPSVLHHAIPRVTNRRMLGRFAGQIEGVQLEVTAENVAEIFARNPSAHVKVADSEKAFAELYSGQILSNALSRALADVPQEDRAELQDYLAARMEEEAVVKARERVLRRDIMTKWKAARAELAQRAADEVWPMLANGTWCPSVELADALAARSDFAEAVRTWRKLDGLESLAKAGDGKVLLEETEGLTDRRMSEALERSRKAVVAQLAGVDAVRAGVLETARKEKPNLKGVIEQLTAATQSFWETGRVTTLWPEGRTPSNVDEQYVTLFPSVVRKIELVAREILEEVNEPTKPEPTEAKPEEKPEEPPEETPPEETPQPPEENPEDEMLLSIAVKRVSGGIELKLLRGKTVVSESVVPMKDSDFQREMSKISGALFKELNR